MQRRIIFAPRSFPAIYPRESHPLDDVFEMLLNGDQYALISPLQDEYPATERDEILLRLAVESSVIEDYDVEPPLRLVTTFSRAHSGLAIARTEFFLR